MINLFRKRRPAVQAEEAPPAAVSMEPPSHGHEDLLRRWMSLAEMQQRVIQALAGEVTRTSSFVETEADALSLRFQRLAVSAQQQTARVDGLTELAMGIKVGGKEVTIDEIAAMLESTLGDVVTKILLLSKDSMSMVYAMDMLGGSAHRVEACLARMDELNRTTNMLALNARIEAERAGEAGLAFRVVADEVRGLSKSMQGVSASMSTEIKAILDGIAKGHETLHKVSTVDMSENILVKERLDVLLPALIVRNVDLKDIVASTVAESRVISGDVSGMVTGIQFQDRTKQRLEHVVDTLQVIGQAIEEVKRGTVAAAPALEGAATVDTEWVKALLSRYTMSEMRERFVAQILDGEPDAWDGDGARHEAPSDGGSAELF